MGSILLKLRTIADSILVLAPAVLIYFIGLPLDAYAEVSACGGLSAGPITVRISIGGGCGGGIADALCTVVSWFNGEGGIGSAIASFAVIFLGINAFFGKVTWGTAVTVATGIFAIFSSDAILSALGMGASGCGLGGE